MVFIWVGEGKVEPYIPPPRSTSVSAIHQPNSPDSLTEVKDEGPKFAEPSLHEPVSGIRAYEETQEELIEASRFPKLARQIMTAEVISFEPPDSLKYAQSIFEKKRFRHIPVVSQKKLVGILSDRELLQVLVRRERGERLDLQTVGQLMKTKILSAEPNSSLRDIAHTMLEERIGSMPVCSHQGELLGIITRSDILRIIVSQGSLDAWA